MTRDEAIEIEKKKLTAIPHDREWVDKIAAANIDALIELGLLKVDDKPKTPYQKLDDLIKRKNCYGDHMTANIFSLVDQAGLKIVDSDV